MSFDTEETHMKNTVSVLIAALAVFTMANVAIAGEPPDNLEQITFFVG